MTNREEYLNNIDDGELADMIISHISSNCNYCPITISRCNLYSSYESCAMSIEKWLGEKA